MGYLQFEPVLTAANLINLLGKFSEFRLFVADLRCLRQPVAHWQLTQLSLTPGTVSHLVYLALMISLGDHCQWASMPVQDLPSAGENLSLSGLN